MFKCRQPLPQCKGKLHPCIPLSSQPQRALYVSIHMYGVPGQRVSFLFEVSRRTLNLFFFLWKYNMHVRHCGRGPVMFKRLCPALIILQTPRLTGAGAGTAGATAGTAF